MFDNFVIKIVPVEIQNKHSGDVLLADEHASVFGKSLFKKFSTAGKSVSHLSSSIIDVLSGEEGTGYVTP